MQVARCVFGNCKTVALQCTVPAAENGRRIYVQVLLEAALSRRPPLPEIVLWIAASRSPSESQTSECSDLLSRSRVTFVIVTQRQPGKLRHFPGPGGGTDFRHGRSGPYGMYQHLVPRSLRNVEFDWPW